MSTRESRRLTRGERRLLLMRISRTMSAVIPDSGGVAAHDRIIENLAHENRTDRRRVKDNRGETADDCSPVLSLVEYLNHAWSSNIDE